LPQRVNFAGYAGKNLLEIGCGIGIDLIKFAQGNATVTGIDLSQKAIELAAQNFAQHNLPATLCVMDGEAMEFPDNHFDVVYAHGVLQYTANPAQMIAEIHRVLRRNGTAILMVYNKNSWLYAMSKLTGVALEHIDAPHWQVMTMPAFSQLLTPFTTHTIIPERYPVKTQLHSGTKAKLFNSVFVNTFNALPKRLTRPLGWHLLAFVTK
jgi:ubiquinone/menaquinone biosynthesis C-methylase UbiE